LRFFLNNHQIHPSVHRHQCIAHFSKAASAA